jgi:hypothetical protein
MRGGGEKDLRALESSSNPKAAFAILRLLVRAAFKGTELRDLRKARWYLDRWIEVREAQLAGRKAGKPRAQA